MRRWATALACALGALICLGATLTPPKAFRPLEPLFRATAGERWSDRAAQVWAESGFNAKVVNAIGAGGLGQFMPGTWADAQKQGWVPQGADRLDPAAAIPAQHRYMLQLEAQARSWLGPCPKDGGWWDAGLGGYNAGPGNIKKALRIARDMGDTRPDAWKSTLVRVTKDHSKETLDYIPRIYRFRSSLEGK